MMKTLLSYLVIAAFITTQTAWAGLPPTSVQGQADASAKTKFNFQVPNSQMTDLGGIKALLETGNQNYLPNASFENTNYASGWTITTATGAVETSTVYSGKQAAKITYSATTGDIAESVTPISNTSGLNLEASCKVNTTLSTIQVCALSGGTEVQCVNAPSSGTWAYVSASMPGPSNGTSVGVRVKTTASTTGTAYVDDCYVGPSRLIGQGAGLSDAIVATTSITATTTAPTKGTVSADRFEWSQVGDKMQIHVQYVQTAAGAAGSGTYLFTLPNSLQIDTSKMNVSSSATSNVGHGKLSNNSGSQGPSTIPIHVVPYDSTHLALEYTDASASNLLTDTGYVGSSAYSLASTNLTITFDAVVYIKGWTGNQAGYRADATPASWSGYETATGGWSVTSTTYADFSAGTSTAVNLITTRNVSTVSAAGSGVAGISPTLPRTGMWEVCADPMFVSVNTTWSIRLVDGSGTVINPGISTFNGVSGGTQTAHVCGKYNAATTTPTFKIQAQSSSGAVTLSSGSVGIIWNLTELDAPMPAPYLTGSVTSTTSGQLHDESALITNNGTCAISSQTGSWLSSVAHSGAAGSGVCTLNFAANEFSSAPICVCSRHSSSTGECSVGSETATSMNVYLANSAGTGTDLDFTIRCQGPH